MELDLEDDRPDDFSEYRRRVRYSQKDDHKRLLDRLSGIQLSEAGELVRDYIRLCGASKGACRPFRCGYPLCPTCGTSQKNQIARKTSDLVRQWIKLYGSDHVSALSLNDDPCDPELVPERVTSFRRSVTNSFSRNLTDSYFVGEFELEPKVSKKVSSHGVSTTVPPKLMVHLHGVIAHPQTPRDEVRSTLQRLFPAERAVGLTAISDRTGYNGQPQDGVIRWLQYTHDKGSAVKGGDREGVEPAVQGAVFDAYAQLSGATRRRKRLRINPPRVKRALRGLAHV